MSLVNQNFKNALDKLKRDNWCERILIEPSIPEKKLKNAISSIGVKDNSSILVIVDDSVFQSGKRGVVITEDSVYWKESFNKGSIKIENINSVEAKKGFVDALTINGNDITLGQFSVKEIQPLSDFLNEITLVKIWFI